MIDIITAAQNDMKLSVAEIKLPNDKTTIPFKINVDIILRQNSATAIKMMTYSVS
jgi:hypothetical protein